MGLKIVLILVLLAAVVGGAVAVAIAMRRHQAEERRRRERRFEVPETAERVPLVEDEAAVARRAERRAELVGFLARDEALAEAAADAASVDDDPFASEPPPQARFVSTPEGEMLLTAPPFELRASLFTDRAGRYATAIARRLPPWVVIAPRVRLETLLSPTPPDGRDADDWRTWRRRVRMRSVDLLLVDRRTWAPLVAIVFQRHTDARRLERGGDSGRDMMVDEVLRHVGLPVVVATGRLAEDWPMMRPWIEQALIEGPAEPRPNGTHAAGRTTVPPRSGWDASAAVALLGLDDDDELAGPEAEDEEDGRGEAV